MLYDFNNNNNNTAHIKITLLYFECKRQKQTDIQMQLLYPLQNN